MVFFVENLSEENFGSLNRVTPRWPDLPLIPGKKPAILLKGLDWPAAAQQQQLQQKNTKSKFLTTFLEYVSVGNQSLLRTTTNPQTCKCDWESDRMETKKEEEKKKAKEDGTKANDSEKADRKEKEVIPLDEDDIALMKSYVCTPSYSSSSLYSSSSPSQTTSSPSSCHLFLLALASF